MAKDLLSRVQGSISLRIIGLLVMLLIVLSSVIAQEFCWKDSEVRGVGTAPTDCGGGEYIAGLCYSKCDSGYVGSAAMCVQESCPEGFRDDGRHCAKPRPYDRGRGYAIERKCKSDHGNCEKEAALWYPVCREGYEGTATQCRFVSCPAGMNDIGVSCEKQSYRRGAGTVPDCSSGLEKHQGVCYIAFSFFT